MKENDEVDAQQDDQSHLVVQATVASYLDSLEKYQLAKSKLEEAVNPLAKSLSDNFWRLWDELEEELKSPEKCISLSHGTLSCRLRYVRSRLRRRGRRVRGLLRRISDWDGTTNEALYDDVIDALFAEELLASDLPIKFRTGLVDFMHGRRMCRG